MRFSPPPNPIFPPYISCLLYHTLMHLCSHLCAWLLCRESRRFCLWWIYQTGSWRSGSFQHRSRHGATAAWLRNLHSGRWGIRGLHSCVSLFSQGFGFLMWYVWGDDALDSPEGNVGEFGCWEGAKLLQTRLWVTVLVEQLAGVVRGHCSRGVPGIPTLQAELYDSLGCNVGEFVMLGPHIFANEVMGAWTLMWNNWAISRHIVTEAVQLFL